MNRSQIKRGGWYIKPGGTRAIYLQSIDNHRNALEFIDIDNCYLVLTEDELVEDYEVFT